MNRLSLLLLSATASALSLLSGCATHSCHSDLKVPPRESFTESHFAGPSGYCYPVYRTPRNGPPVLVLHELNGLSAPPLHFADELGNRGWTVYAPALFGKYGESRPIGALRELKRDRRWKLYDADDSGPVLDDVGALVGWISKRHGGQRVIVMGNCLTGGFPFAYLGRADVKAAILCQPAMPTPTFWQSLLKNQPAELKQAIAIPPAQVNRTLHAMKRDRSKVLLGYHYAEDPIAPIAKFDWLRVKLASQGLATRFKPVVLVPAGFENPPTWWETHPTKVGRSLLKPHNTVTESGSAEDRKAMREHLYRKLESLRGT